MIPIRSSSAQPPAADLAIGKCRRRVLHWQRVAFTAAWRGERVKKRIGLLFIACAIHFSDVGAQPTAPVRVFPTKPVRLVVGFPAGSSSDIVGRLLGQKMSE